MTKDNKNIIHYLVRHNEAWCYSNPEENNDYSSSEITIASDINYKDDDERLSTHELVIKDLRNQCLYIAVYLQYAEAEEASRVHNYHNVKDFNPNYHKLNRSQRILEDEIYIFALKKQEIDYINYNDDINNIDIKLYEMIKKDNSFRVSIDFKNDKLKEKLIGIDYLKDNKHIKTTKFEKALAAAAVAANKLMQTHVDNKLRVIEILPNISLNEDINNDDNTLQKIYTSILKNKKLIRLKYSNNEEDKVLFKAITGVEAEDDTSVKAFKENVIDNNDDNDDNDIDDDEDNKTNIKSKRKTKNDAGHKQYLMHSHGFNCKDKSKDLNQAREGITYQLIEIPLEAEKLLMQKALTYYIQNIEDEEDKYSSNIFNNLCGDIIGIIQNDKVNREQTGSIYKIFGNNTENNNKIKELLKVFGSFDINIDNNNINDDNLKYIIKDLDIRIARVILALNTDELKILYKNRNKGKYKKLIKEFKDEIIKLNNDKHPADSRYMIYDWRIKSILNTKMHKLIDMALEIKEIKDIKDIK